VVARRLKRFNVYLRSAGRVTAAPPIPQRFAPGTQAIATSGDRRFAGQTPLTPFLAFLSGLPQHFAPDTHAHPKSSDPQFAGLRMLVPGLILLALLPNLTLGAFFWFGVIYTPWSRPVTLAPNESPAPAPRSAIPAPVLSAPAMLEATAGEHVTFPVALDGTDGVPARSVIAIRGLPQGSKLSSGRPYDETEWTLKPDEIGDLQLVLPNTASGMAKLVIQLVAPDGAIIADATTVLRIAADPKADIGASNIKLELTEVQVSPAQRPEATGVGESLAKLAAATTPAGDPVPLPTRRPTPSANRNDGASWIKPLTFVNLREGPSPSTRVISVVAKGAKLRVIGRKKRWVQVTNPATSQSGWIYTGKVATTP
jgi:hypothetical protein